MVLMIVMRRLCCDFLVQLPKTKRHKGTWQGADYQENKRHCEEGTSCAHPNQQSCNEQQGKHQPNYHTDEAADGLAPCNRRRASYDGNHAAALDHLAECDEMATSMGMRRTLLDVVAAKATSLLALERDAEAAEAIARTETVAAEIANKLISALQVG